ncbi:MAG: glycosyltransferase family 4 protein [bacterium]
MNHPLYVLQLNATNFVPDMGGIATYNHELAHHIGLRGHSVELLTYPSAGPLRAGGFAYTIRPGRSFDLREVVARGGSRAFLLRSLPPKVAGMTRVALRALRIAPAGSRRVLWAMTWWPEGIAAWLAGRLRRVPYFVSAHGYEAVIPKTARRHLLYRSVMGQAAAVFAVSRHTAGLLELCGVPPERIRVIPNGVDPDRFRLTAEVAARMSDLRRRFLLDGCYVLLTIARLTERKGHMAVLRALAALRGAAPDLRYVIAGEGPMRPRLEEAVVGLRLEGVVAFAGEVSEPDKLALLHGSDVFVMPNRDIPLGKGGVDTEGFGMVFLEAAACGKPVVAGRAGGAVEAVVDGCTGILVDPLDDGEVREALQKLRRDRELAARLGRAGLARVKRDFTWVRISETYCNELEAGSRQTDRSRLE